MGTRRIYATTRSPYVRKVLLILERLGLDHEVESVSLRDPSDEFTALGPLRKVPILADEDGTVVQDSTLILEYLHERYGRSGEVWPVAPAERLLARVIEDWSDTLAEDSVALRGELARGDKSDPEEIEQLRARIARTFDALEEQTGALDPKLPRAAEAAVLAALGYNTFRHGDGWRARHPKLAAFFEQMHEWPRVRETMPR